MIEAIEKVVNPHTLGDPTGPLLWTSKSFRNIGKEMEFQGFKVGHASIGEILKSKNTVYRGTRKQMIVEV